MKFSRKEAYNMTMCTFYHYPIESVINNCTCMKSLALFNCISRYQQSATKC